MTDRGHVNEDSLHEVTRPPLSALFRMYPEALIGRFAARAATEACPQNGRMGNGYQRRVKSLNGSDLRVAADYQSCFNSRRYFGDLSTYD